MLAPNSESIQMLSESPPTRRKVIRVSSGGNSHAISRAIPKHQTTACSECSRLTERHELLGRRAGIAEKAFTAKKATGSVVEYGKFYLAALKSRMDTNCAFLELA